MSLTAEPSISQDFFIAGGTLPLQSHSYVERVADSALLEALLKGRFCYVLNSRQMGKSSLCVRTMSRLEAQGVKCAFVDITKIGGQNVTPEQWYAGLAIEVGRALNLRSEFLEYWKAEGHVSPMQRFFGALHDVALARLSGKVVIFVDEIDSTRSLPFNTDEFFAGVRECFNRRVQDESYDRLTFCFLGVAIPSDLIKDARTTPFNIGERIYLKDFTYEELMPLSKMLGAHGEEVLKRVFYWTNGHPFLTQSICRTLVERNEALDEKAVDSLIYRDLLEPKVRETNINLSDVGNRVLNGYADGDDVARFRADILSAYSKSISGKETLQDDESNRVTAVLKLSGLMRSEGKTLKIRNRIYEQAFDKAWIRENMPGQELRRQRRAFLVGVFRTGSVAAIVIAVIAYLAFANRALAIRAEAVARENRYQAYVATMDLMPVIYDQKNIARMRKLLTGHEKDPWRGLEWSYWDRMSHEAVAESADTGPEAYSMSLSDNNKLLVSANGSEITFYDAQTLDRVRKIDVSYQDVSTASWIPGSENLLILRTGGGGAVIDSNGKEQVGVPSDFQTRPVGPLFLDRGKIVFGGTPQGFGFLDLKTGKFAKIGAHLPPTVGQPACHDKVIAFIAGETPSLIRTFDVRTLKVLKEYRVPFQPFAIQYFPDGLKMMLGGREGELAVLDLVTGMTGPQIKISEPVLGFTISRDGTLIGLTIRSRAAALLDCNNDVLRFRRWYPEANVAILYPDKSRFATMYFNIKLYDPTVPPVTQSVQVAGGPWNGRMRRDGDRKILSYVAQGTNTLTINEVDDRKLIPRLDLTGRTIPINGEATDPNRFEVLMAHGNASALEDFHGHFLMKVRGTGSHAAISSGGDHEAVTLDGFTIAVYSRKTGALEGTVKWRSRVAGLLFDWQGKYLAVSEDSGGGGVIDSDGWKVLWSHAIHAQGIRSGRFSSDGKVLLTCGDDDRAKLWDVVTGKQLQEFYGHAQSVIDGDISPDGSRVITVSDDQTVRVWDTETGLELTTLGTTGPFPLVCQLTPDGKYVVTADSEGEVKFWPITEQ